MKRIIAFTSLFFVLLMTVLPVQTANVSAAENVEVTSVKLITSDGEVEGVGSNNGFTFNLDALAEEVLVYEIQFTSETAAYLSYLPREELKAIYEEEVANAENTEEIPSLEEFYDMLDIQFKDGVAYLNYEKYVNWAERFGTGEEIPTEDDVTVGDGYLITVGELRSLEGLPLYAGNAAGNEVEVSLNFAATEELNGWIQENNLWYFYEDGELVKGWLLDGQTWYYLDAKTGVMQTGWEQVGGKWYYFSKSGLMQTGWLKIGTTWYYLDAVNGDMKTGWYKVNGTTWYYFAKSGVMQTNWIKLGGTWYYLDAKNGDMKTGWSYIGGNWYLFKTTGAMLTGWQYVGGKWYYMYSSGAMAKNTWIGGYKLNASGAWVR